MGAPALNTKPSESHGRNEKKVIVVPKDSSNSTPSYPDFYSPHAGICSSKHPTVPLPNDPFLDAVSFIFSHKHDGQTALIDSASGSSILYKDLLPIIISMAGGIQAMGVKKGDIVLLLLPNSITYPVVFLSVVYVGAIVSTMNPLSSVLEIKKQVHELSPCMAFTCQENDPKLESFGLPLVCVPGSFNFDMESNKLEAFNQLVNGGNVSLFRKPVIRQEDAAAILYSSGTTGASKGVVLTHKNLISMVELLVRHEASMYEDWPGFKNVYLAAIPMFHIYGIALFVTGLFSMGTCVVVMRKFDAGEAVMAIDRFGVTHFPLVPPILAAIAKNAKGVSGIPLKSLKQVSSGAAPVSGRDIEDFLRTFPHVDFIQGYGMTESAAVGTRGFNTKNMKKYSSVGLLAPNTEAKVLDLVTCSFVPPGCVGQLCLRGPGIMKGYLNYKEATALAIDEDGWLYTGDIGYIDNDGYIFILDRLKDVIKYKGFQVAPVDLERVLISHPEVLDVAVTGASDKESGEIPVAFVVKVPGSSTTEAEIVHYVASQVAPYKKVWKVAFVKVIPRSPAGKILRRELKNSIASRL